MSNTQMHFEMLCATMTGEFVMGGRTWADDLILLGAGLQREEAEDCEEFHFGGIEGDEDWELIRPVLDALLRYLPSLRRLYIDVNEELQVRALAYIYLALPSALVFFRK